MTDNSHRIKAGVWPMVLLTALLLGACGGGAGLPSTEPSPAMRSPGLEQLIALAKADLAGRVGISADAISVERVENVTWSDTSLGCPAPGMVYAQMIVPGYRMMLEAGAQEYTYHTDLDAQVIYCVDGLQPLAITPDPGDIKDSQPWLPVN